MEIQIIVIYGTSKPKSLVRYSIKQIGSRAHQSLYTQSCSENKGASINKTDSIQESIYIKPDRRAAAYYIMIKSIDSPTLCTNQPNLIWLYCSSSVQLPTSRPRFIFACSYCSEIGFPHTQCYSKQQTGTALYTNRSDAYLSRPEAKVERVPQLSDILGFPA